MCHLINLCVGGAVKSLPDGPWLHVPSDQPVRGGAVKSLPDGPWLHVPSDQPVRGGSSEVAA